MPDNILDTAPEFLGPISLLPIVQERIWGVSALPDWYAQPAHGKPIGEVWLTANECVAQAGEVPLGTLNELVAKHPALFGAGKSAEFPLLIKVLFPREKLSVQVHPNDAQANAMGQPRGKTECWYILSAEPGAEIALGFREEFSADQLREAIASKTLEEMLDYVPVQAGDMVYVDAGTVHAIGPGMVVLETQQYCDVTYRLYDYGRPRELHVDAGLAVSQTNTDAGLIAPVEKMGFTQLVTSPYFVVDRFLLNADEPKALGKSGELQVLVALDAGCSVQTAAGHSVALEPGKAVLLPAEPVEYLLRSGAAAKVIRIVER